MARDLEWHTLRVFGGSQEAAFEELCCQLASCEPAPEKAKFIRKGAPDAGVECYWQLPNSDEWGWQAKFFLSPPNTSQWQQIDDSVKNALEKHPKLVSYTVCLPIDRPDPRSPGRRSFMDRWEEHVEKWQGWAGEKGVSVGFEYWGQHELFQRLGRDEHRGRFCFWFNQDEFTPEWFRQHVESTVANAGERYTPELNVDLPVAQLFDGLGRTGEFNARVMGLCHKLRLAHRGVRPRDEQTPATELFDSVRHNVEEIASILESAVESATAPIGLQRVTQLCAETGRSCWTIIEALDEAIQEARTRKKTNKKATKQTLWGRADSLSFLRHHVYGLCDELRAVDELAVSNETGLANQPALLLTGAAGTGKTHLLCDVAERRTDQCLPTVLLFGERFKDDEPWAQILNQLHLTCSKDEFLGALDAAAEACRSRALIMIDALNEGPGRLLWPKYLSGMLVDISRHSYIGIALTLRSPYQQVVVPAGLCPERLLQEEHVGFQSREHRAVQMFFRNYGIQAPSVPLLLPEFHNPLFLKLFCAGLKNRNLTTVPSGLQGITSIFEFFLESIGDKVANRLGFDPKAHLLRQAVDNLAAVMADTGDRIVPRAEAQRIVDELLPGREYDHSLFRHMILEGILAETLALGEDEEWVHVIRFSYERFTDHLLVQNLLERHLDSANPEASFRTDQPLGHLLCDEHRCWRHSGILHALAIQLPERVSRELSELAPHAAEFGVVKRAFVDSLCWRRRDAFGGPANEYINEHILSDEMVRRSFLDVLLTVAPIPDHPYNADRLHGFLMEQQLANRDAWWSTFLHRQYRQEGAVDRLIDWAWSTEDRGHISDDAIRLSSVALSWFLTSSNRFLRDRATKALVTLLTPRLPVVRRVLEDFAEVNDPYVSQRLYAVAYGCCMRSADMSAIRDLAHDVYTRVFSAGQPPPDVLLRDYARGVIEVARERGTSLEVDSALVRPPYESSWPADIPTSEELEKLVEEAGEKSTDGLSLSAIYWSLKGGDFGRYIVDSGTRHWTAHRLGVPRTLTPNERYFRFLRALTKRQEKAWYRFESALSLRYACRPAFPGASGTHIGKKEAARLKKLVLEEEQRLRNVLGKRKLAEYQAHIVPYLAASFEPSEESFFDSSLAERWVFTKVLELGWDAELFGAFDRTVAGPAFYGRSAHKPERTGKKYQWIAYHECMARIADNFEFKAHSWDRAFEYEGPWQFSIRDIDPSCTVRNAKRENWGPHSCPWFSPIAYDNWTDPPSSEEWVANDADLPAAGPLIGVTNPDDGTRWLVLESWHEWDQPSAHGQKKFEQPTRQLWYMLKSYIVKKSNMKAMFSWAGHQDFSGRWMPESSDALHVFLGEYFWGRAHDSELPHYVDFVYAERHGVGRPPRKLLVTCEGYFWEPGEDCSIEKTISIRLPSKWLADRMQLRRLGPEGELCDPYGNLVAFDPSVTVPGPGTLLISRDAFLEFLDENGYAVFWTLLGEKLVIGGSPVQPARLGRLGISGCYCMEDGEIRGGLHTHLVR